MVQRDAQTVEGWHFYGEYVVDTVHGSAMCGSQVLRHFRVFFLLGFAVALKENLHTKL